MKSILLVSMMLALGAVAASAQRDTISMRDGSTIVTVGGGCLVQYGRGNERINNAVRCRSGDIREADRIISGGRAGYGGPEDDAPGGSWMQSCRDGAMRGPIFSAQCRTENGRWNSATLDMRNCSTGQVENRNGGLVCN